MLQQHGSDEVHDGKLRQANCTIVCSHILTVILGNSLMQQIIFFWFSFFSFELLQDRLNTSLGRTWRARAELRVMKCSTVWPCVPCKNVLLELLLNLSIDDLCQTGIQTF